jgi:L-threonylcarbamoyladenylate synthase
MDISLEIACTLLTQGEVVALPTETVYGLAASMAHPDAVAKIFTLKGRPSNNPLIIHVADLEQIYPYAAEIPPHFTELAASFWPGPLTVVLPIHPHLVPEKIRAGLATAAFRIPQHPLALKVLQSVGPLVMPSANLSGKPSATQAAHVEKDFGSHFPVLEGGACRRGLESTILYHMDGQWRIVRLGSLFPEQFEPLLGYKPPVHQGDKVICPGQLHRHYAPKAQLLINSEFSPAEIGYVLGFSDRNYPDCKIFSLGKSDQPDKIAENLYEALRALDEAKIQRVWVDNDFPQNGLWLTISERLARASCSSPSVL